MSFNDLTENSNHSNLSPNSTTLPKESNINNSINNNDSYQTKSLEQNVPKQVTTVKESCESNLIFPNGIDHQVKFAAYNLFFKECSLLTNECVAINNLINEVNARLLAIKRRKVTLEHKCAVIGYKI